MGERHGEHGGDVTDPDFAAIEHEREMNEGVHPLGDDDLVPDFPDVGKMYRPVPESEAVRRNREVARLWREQDRKEQPQ